MAKEKVIMPKMGESITEATILNWVVEIGEALEQDDPIVEIATDKVDSEVPAPADGKLLEIFFKVGDVVPVGSVIAILETEGAENTDAPTASGNGHQQAKPEPVPVLATAAVGTPSPSPANSPVPVELQSRSGNGRFYSPLVLNIARTEGVSMAELEVIAGSGSGGRVTKKDILSFLKSPRKPVPTTPSISIKGEGGQGFAGVAQRSFSHSGAMEIVEMDRMRRMIADNMVYSSHVSAHVTSFVEVDMTNVVMWRNKNKVAFQEQYGDKLTYTPIFVEALTRALREMPRVNVSVDGNRLLLKKEINMGIAVALPDDNLIVPVIRNADQLSLAGLAKAVNDLANRARNRKLKPEELDGGTYTVSNVGTFGNVMGTPIIMQPQVAIMATGAIRKKPAVIETPTGDLIGIRQMMFLSHSYDHRVVDGALGGRFVRRVGDILEAWDINRPI